MCTDPRESCRESSGIIGNRWNHGNRGESRGITGNHRESRGISGNRRESMGNHRESSGIAGITGNHWENFSWEVLYSYDSYCKFFITIRINSEWIAKRRMACLCGRRLAN
ncbi:Bifunctional dihydrofolate reductase-thymidylate synthase [Frankliniella fusca]|uniref:Bifunctional dihydrofolate reductase-thymidylate synthase n=1 Tax=Frankliniella fusca TaxID=407009 RepID=A0AAE1HLL5_9NEOP|nr:Bifunctional dihydrofolate reductase-thymidylate synthase [Frankliniella fusca]